MLDVDVMTKHCHTIRIGAIRRVTDLQIPGIRSSEQRILTAIVVLVDSVENFRNRVHRDGDSAAKGHSCDLSS